MNRGLEAKLLLIVSLFLLLLVVHLYRSGEGGERLWRLAGLLGGYWAVYAVKRWRWPQTDTVLLPATYLLNLLGLVELYGLEPALADRQVLWVLIGLGGLCLLALLPDYRTLLEYRYSAAVLALVLLGATLAVGTRIGGAKSWLSLGVLRFQPVEAVKLLMVVSLAGYLDEHRELLSVNWRSWGRIGLPAPQALVPLGAIWGLSLLLVAVQRDLGAGLILFCTLVTMLYLATGRSLYLVTGAALLLAGLVAGYHLFGHVQERIRVWLDPWSEAYGAGYQVLQGLFALAEGGLVGTGVGRGYGHLIPASATDYLFAVLAEEMGLAGALGVIGLYLILAWRGFGIAAQSQDAAGSLLAGGLTALLALQSLVLLAGVTRLFPLTGVTLPLFSYGGSSTVVFYLVIGLLLQLGGRRIGPEEELT